MNQCNNSRTIAATSTLSRYSVVFRSSLVSCLSVSLFLLRLYQMSRTWSVSAHHYRTPSIFTTPTNYWFTTTLFLPLDRLCALFLLLLLPPSSLRFLVVSSPSIQLAFFSPLSLAFCRPFFSNQSRRLRRASYISFCCQ